MTSNLNGPLKASPAWLRVTVERPTTVPAYVSRMESSVGPYASSVAVLNPVLYAQLVDLGRQPVTWLGTIRSPLTNQYVGPAIVPGLIFSRG
jgi:hypothetical protein